MLILITIHHNVSTPQKTGKIANNADPVQTVSGAILFAQWHFFLNIYHGTFFAQTAAFQTKFQGSFEGYYGDIFLISCYLR